MGEQFTAGHRKLRWSITMQLTTVDIWYKYDNLQYISPDWTCGHKASFAPFHLLAANSDFYDLPLPYFTAIPRKSLYAFEITDLSDFMRCLWQVLKLFYVFHALPRPVNWVQVHFIEDLNSDSSILFFRRLSRMDWLASISLSYIWIDIPNKLYIIYHDVSWVEVINTQTWRFILNDILYFDCLLF